MEYIKDKKYRCTNTIQMLYVGVIERQGKTYNRFHTIENGVIQTSIGFDYDLDKEFEEA